jgi:hypothetical protein
MRRAAPLACLLLAALGFGACDWTEFDDLQLQTPIRALPRPDDMDSNLYPRFVLPVPAPHGNAQLLVLGSDNVALADFSFGPDGRLGTQTVSNDRFLLGGAKLGALAVAAYLPGTDEVPRIVAVTEEERQPVVIQLDSTDAAFAVTALGAALVIEAGAIAVGEARVAGETDVVVTSGKQLLVLPNARVDGAQSCDLTSAVAALAVGDHWIVAGQPADPGDVWLVRPDYLPGTDDTCADVAHLEGRTASLGFGAALVVAETDVAGTRDIVVSAPNERTVYVYAAADVTAPKTTHAVAGGTTGCGTAIAVGTVEGRRTLVIGDPGDPGDVAAAGVVWMVDLASGELLPQLDRPTDAVRRFGEQVGVLSFTGSGSAVDLVWVAAQSVTEGDPGVVYLYYWVHEPESDPRVF